MNKTDEYKIEILPAKFIKVEGEFFVFKVCLSEGVFEERLFKNDILFHGIKKPNRIFIAIFSEPNILHITVRAANHYHRLFQRLKLE